jgi:uncharacterized protein (TIGR02246 family)
MKRIILTLLFFAVLIVASISQTNIKPSESDEKMVRDLLRIQEDAWNGGNIEMFMTTYWKSPELVFIGSKGITHGWKGILERYKKNYPDTVTMGKLKFDILELNQIEKNTVFLIGKYTLTRSIGNVSGMFTLVLKKIKGQWLIISDHSS